MKDKRNVFESLERQKLRDILGKTHNNRLKNLALLFNIDNKFWDDCPENVKEKFKCLLKEEKADLIFYGIFVVHLLSGIKNHILAVYQKKYINNYGGNLIIIRGLKRAKANRKESGILAQEIVNLNLNIFINSTSYKWGRENAEENIRPIIPIMTYEDIKYLLEQIVEEQTENGQLIDCIFIFKELFQETINIYPDTLTLWKKFYESILNKRAWSGIEELKQMIDNFAESKQLETEPF
ncbi:MAG: hypothetical protein AB4080_09915 [Trichodesmium sp.]